MGKSIASSVALMGLTLASLALPCFAAGRQVAANPMASHESGAPMGCEAPEEADRGMLCAAPGTNAPLRVAAAEAPMPEALLGAPATDLPKLFSRAVSVAQRSHGHYPPRADLPAFLLHAALLI